MNRPTTHIGETAVYKNPNEHNPAHHGSIVAVELSLWDECSHFWYLLEMPDGTNKTVCAEMYGIVRRGNRFACTVCKGFGENTDDSKNIMGWDGQPLCVGCQGSRVIQPGQTWEAP